mmetsp:Transcript_65423/g.210900  ORF Transcript_65423/g.210900 Transcript_65423/m.210900 type:complete len:231 (-) Transcript_65423:3346-4038(-)
MGGGVPSPAALLAARAAERLWPYLPRGRLFQVLLRHPSDGRAVHPQAPSLLPGRVQARRSRRGRLRAGGGPGPCGPHVPQQSRADGAPAPILPPGLPHRHAPQRGNRLPRLRQVPEDCGPRQAGRGRQRGRRARCAAPGPAAHHWGDREPHVRRRAAAAGHHDLPAHALEWAVPDHHHPDLPHLRGPLGDPRRPAGDALAGAAGDLHRATHQARTARSDEDQGRTHQGDQ